MAPPPFVDLFDWRVPYVEVLAMICVSRVYDRDAFGDGLRAPPRTGRFSPAARANGVARSATSTAATTIQGPLPRKGMRLRMRVSIGGRPPWSIGGERQACHGARTGASQPCLWPCNIRAPEKVAVLQGGCHSAFTARRTPAGSRRGIATGSVPGRDRRAPAVPRPRRRQGRRRRPPLADRALRRRPARG